MNEFYERMKMILGEDYDAFISSLDKSEVKAFYLNRKKEITTPLFDHLTPHAIVKDAYYYKVIEPGKSPYFLAGLYYIQDPSAMLVSEFLDIKEDDYVIDLCAAPGGKSCMAGSMLSKKGLLISNDINKKRARILSENIERFGLTNTIVTSTDPKNFTKELEGCFDKVILDAPCSGEGMFRKYDQAITTWSVDKVTECALIQKSLIDTAYQLLKPGGLLMYSTCTYEVEENEDIVTYALNNYELELVDLPKSHGLQPGIGYKEVVRCYPHQYKGEGQFIALMRKTTGLTRQIRTKHKLLTPASKKVLNQFYKDYLTINAPSNCIENNGHIYMIQPHFPTLKGIQVLRNGLYLGEIRKNRFIPSHSLALSLKKEDVKYTYDFKENSVDIQKYIHGETLPYQSHKGYGLVLVDGYPLSFYKESNEVKNLFPKGLRR